MPSSLSRLFLLCTLLALGPGADAQRTWKQASVLRTGAWYRVAVGEAGVYRVDLPLLSALGVNPSGLSADAIRVYGNGGAPLPESNAAPAPDDLEEVAIQVEDGGDGLLNGGDYLLFYAPGPHRWQPSAADRRFTWHRNLYTDKAYYYITIGGAGGKRIATQTDAAPVTQYLSDFDERYAHELDSVNFLSSGKEWFGEELSDAPGRSLTRSFTPALAGLVAGAPMTLQARAVARSVGAPARFALSLDGTGIGELSVPATGPGVYDPFGHPAETAVTFPAPAAETPSLVWRYFPGSFNSQGWIDRWLLFYRRRLQLPAGGQLSFRDWRSLNPGPIGFTLGAAGAGTKVWDVTEPQAPVALQLQFSGNDVSFSRAGGGLREFIAFGEAKVPEPLGRVANQDLHGLGPADYLIITHPSFLSEARRLAAFHRERQGLRTVVATTEQVFHEFGGGAPDPSALRNFVRMFYDRQRADWNGSSKYLLLLGKASFDYKDRVRNNTNLVPAYESPASLDPLNTYASDDFFGFLEEGEDINGGATPPDLDIGIGRIPARTPEEAKAYIDKVIAYHSPEAFGPWRQQAVFVADDEDFNLHLQDAEILTATAKEKAPALNLRKVYLDAFRQEAASVGGRYPAANALINNDILNGTLIWNYSGHGGPQRLAEEVVLDASILSGWKNEHRLPLFIAATCDFAPFDHPGTPSLGEALVLRPKTGAIALMATSRVVFAFSNRILNNNYIATALEADAAGNYRSLGEAVRVAKNRTYAASADLINNRKFLLLGDPATTLAFPKLQVQATVINGKPAGTDTLQATEEVVLEGTVTNRNGALLADFSGTVFLSLFDKEQSRSTLGNDPGSQPVGVITQSDLLFKGKVTAAGGKFAFRFRLPKDMDYRLGQGKISLYAHDSTRDGGGFSREVHIGGIAAGGSRDGEGPGIRAYLNDERFVPGSITDPAPVLVVKLADSSGIRTGNSGIGHDLVVTLDKDPNRFFILNDFYESDLDSYRTGTVRFQLPDLEPGAHTLTIKAWDVLNNSSEQTLEFVVVPKEDLKIDHVLNYPNPFTTHTEFWFEHNQPGTALDVTVEVYTVSGKLVKMLKKTINSAGNRSSDIAWDGTDEFGARIGRGVYLYRLRVKRADGKEAKAWNKLVIL